MSTHILVVDDEPDVESMFRQHFRHDLRSGRFIMKFALSAPAALERSGNGSRSCEAAEAITFKGAGLRSRAQTADKSLEPAASTR